MASEERDRLLQNLRRLSLPHAAQNIDEHLKQAGSLKLGHLAFLARIAEAEILARQQTRADRRMRQAEFPEVCRIEDYDFKQQPCIDRKSVLNLAELGFVDRCESVLRIPADSATRSGSTRAPVPASPLRDRSAATAPGSGSERSDELLDRWGLTSRGGDAWMISPSLPCSSLRVLSIS